MRTLEITKKVYSVEVDVEIDASDILEIFNDRESMELFEELAEKLGYVKKKDLNLEEGTLSERLKILTLADIVKKATLEQLENFEKSL